jgi:rSAM/selenodomain-associated transferase 1
VGKVDKPQQKQAKKAILAIFAKQPIPGQVKTRLCPPLNDATAAALYLESLMETVERMQQGNNYDLALCYAGDQQWFVDTFPGILLNVQQGNDLGERMARALNDFLTQGYLRVVLIGSDVPDLPEDIVGRAFNALESVDLVLVPTVDGGYCLVGESNHHPQLFENISWSSESVLVETLEKAKVLKISSELLAEWEDLDDIAALQRYLKRSPEGRTARYLKTVLAEFPSLDDCLT